MTRLTEIIISEEHSLYVSSKKTGLQFAQVKISLQESTKVVNHVRKFSDIYLTINVGYKAKITKNIHLIKQKL